MVGRKLPVVFGIRNPVLSDEHMKFFRYSNPLGFIFFDGSVENVDQFKSLIKSLKDALDDQNLLFLIDQEGGKIRRLKKLGGVFADKDVSPSQFHYYTMSQSDGFDAAANLLRINTEKIALALNDVGINVNCAPVLDLHYGSDCAICDRSYGPDGELVKKFGRICCTSYINNGIIPVIKHAPGYGRSLADAHDSIFNVTEPLDELERTDFAIFKALNDFPIVMVGHTKYNCLDANNSASASKECISYIKNDLGFDDKIIISDAIDMKGLDVYGISQRALATLDAGCDITLHCSAIISEMESVAEMLKSRDKYVTPELANKLDKLLYSVFNKKVEISSCVNMGLAL